MRLIVAILSLNLLLATAAQASSLPEFTGLVKTYGPAVVNISTTQKRSLADSLPDGFKMPDLPDGNPLSEFLKRFLGEGLQHRFDDSEEYDAQSLGSGFVIDADGYIVTNNHVVKDAEDIIVRLNDRREFQATVVGTDPRSDLAVLKIEAHDLPVVKTGTSKSLEVGEWVLAIGSPFGFDHSVTAGIVSAKGRALPSENYVPFIQTDVAINPGNSGGPLFNLDGEVVGVNSQIYSRTGGFMGLSFAIPIDVALNVVEQLKQSGHVTRGWLGVLIQDVTRELAESFNLDQPKGALVSRIVADSPAARAGFEVGDIVLEFNGETIHTSSDLPPVVGNTPIGESARVVVLREGNRKQLNVVIGELPSEDELALAPGGAAPQGVSKLGVTVRDLSDDERETMQLGERGVLVERVAGGAAAAAGVREGDVILMLNNEAVNSAERFRALAEALPAGKSIPVLVHRQGTPLFLALKTP